MNKNYQVFRDDGIASVLLSEDEIRRVIPEEYLQSLEFFFNNSRAGDVYKHGEGALHYIVRLGRLFGGEAIGPDKIKDVSWRAATSMATAKEALIEAGGDVELAIALISTQGYR